MPNILTTIQKLIQDCLAEQPGDPPLPAILIGAADELQQLFNLQLEPTGAGLDQWLDQFRALTQNDDLRETLLVRSLQLRLPRLAEALTLIGVVAGEWTEAADRPALFRINWSALDAFGQDPGRQSLLALLQRVQGIPDVKALQVLTLLLIAGPDELVRLEYQRRGFLALPQGAGVSLQDLIDLVNSPVSALLGPALVQAPATPTQLVPGPQVAARIEVVGPDEPFNPAAPLDGLALTLVVDAAALRATRLKLWGTDWQLTGDTSGSGLVEARVRIAGNAIDSMPSGRGNARVRVQLRRGEPAQDDALLFGDRSATHFALGGVGVAASFSPDPSEPVFGLNLTLDQIRLGIGTDLLKPITFGLPLPGQIRFASQVELAFLQGVGLANAPSAGVLIGLDIPRHLGFTVGGSGAGLWLDDLLIRLELAVNGRRLDFRVLLRFDARAELGPLKATLSGAGVWLGRWRNANAGVLEPSGIGLALAAGPVSGGGFFGRVAPGEYGGALTLKILGIGAFAYGLYKELPGGAVSFAAVIGVRLPPPGVQIGFGFAVSGVGGLVGINRRADTDRLRDRLVSGTAGDVLFTDDPTRNAPRILGEMAQLFPAERAVHVFGPTFQLNWLYLIRLDVGLFIELPGPRKIFIVGSGRLVVGTEDFALVYFRLDFIGGIDLTTSLIFLDGALVNSHLLGVLRITGGMALRLGYGSHPFFLFSIGGFHPAFAPGGLAVPQIPRAGASLELGPVWLRQETYFAVTSNTVQFGARTEAGIDIGPISVHGWFGFDALVQFKPFRFTAAIDAGMAATFEGIEFASVRVRGELTGPGPLVLKASASVKVLVRVSKNVTLTLSNRPGESVPVIDNLAGHLKTEIAEPANLRGAGADDAVVYRATPDGATALSPTGDVIWEQKRVPLDRLLYRVEARPLAPPRTLSVTVAGAGTGTEEDLFALGSFSPVSDAEALSGPTFSTGRSGFRLRVPESMDSGPTADQKNAVNVVWLPARRRFGSVFAALPAGLLAGLVAGVGSPLAHEQPRVGVSQEKWQLVGVEGGQHAADAFLAARQSGTAAMPVSTPTVWLTGVL